MLWIVVRLWVPTWSLFCCWTITGRYALISPCLFVVVAFSCLLLCPLDQMGYEFVAIVDYKNLPALWFCGRHQKRIIWRTERQFFFLRVQRLKNWAHHSNCCTEKSPRVGGKPNFFMVCYTSFLFKRDCKSNDRNKTVTLVLKAKPWNHKRLSLLVHPLPAFPSLTHQLLCYSRFWE